MHSHIYAYILLRCLVMSCRGDRGELTQFSLKIIFCQNGTSLLNYVGMLVFHAISHVS